MQVLLLRLHKRTSRLDDVRDEGECVAEEEQGDYCQQHDRSAVFSTCCSVAS